MFPDYQQSVLSTYHQKKATNNLSLRLIHPTPANIRDECIELVKAGIKRKDENILNGLFEARNDAAGYLQLLERCDIDKFKPLINFLKKPDINTAKINIELLAWLIGYEPRPWVMGTEYGNPIKEVSPVAENPDSDITVPEENEVVTISTTESIKEVGAAVKKKGNGRRMIILLSFAALCTGGFFTWNILRGQASCMYWNVDHYEPISCNKKMGTIPVIAYDADRARDFKKIMRPDTITYHSIGKVWYSKSNNKLEFFTSDGMHPLYPDLELKKISSYLISKYFLKDSTQKK